MIELFVMKSLIDDGLRRHHYATLVPSLVDITVINIDEIVYALNLHIYIFICVFLRHKKLINLIWRWIKADTNLVEFQNMKSDSCKCMRNWLNPLKNSSCHFHLYSNIFSISIRNNRQGILLLIILMSASTHCELCEVICAMWVVTHMHQGNDKHQAK